MFYYLSFLRPPPRTVEIGTPISITPQIGNDLRTELFEHPQDIFFSWSLESPIKTLNADNSPVTLTLLTPRKLTRWRHLNAYKQISIPSPPNIRNGQKYRLILTASEGGSAVINLVGNPCGVSPFPVISMPITFTSPSQHALTSGKQEQVERIYVISTPIGNEIPLIVRERTSFDLDKVPTA